MVSQIHIYRYVEIIHLHFDEIYFSVLISRKVIPFMNTYTTSHSTQILSQEENFRRNNYIWWKILRWNNGAKTDHPEEHR